MAQYQEVKKDDGSINPNLVLRVDDMSWIPADPLNLDHQEYLAWKAAGNTPLPPKLVAKPASEVEYEARVLIAKNENEPLHRRLNALVQLLVDAPGV